MDVGASVRRALALGGRELMHQVGEDGTSQWAVLADPNGAAFGVVPVVSGEALPPAEALPENNRVGTRRLARSDGPRRRESPKVLPRGGGLVC